jgi:hypothetical protein
MERVRGSMREGRRVTEKGKKMERVRGRYRNGIGFDSLNMKEESEPCSAMKTNTMPYPYTYPYPSYFFFIQMHANANGSSYMPSLSIPSSFSPTPIPTLPILTPMPSIPYPSLLIPTQHRQHITLSLTFPIPSPHAPIPPFPSSFLLLKFRIPSKILRRGTQPLHISRWRLRANAAVAVLLTKPTAGTAAWVDD